MGWVASTWVMIAMASTTVATTAISMDNQKKINENQIKQGEMDLIASQNATMNAEEEARRQESESLTNIGRELLSSQATATALQANTGIAGVTAEKQKRNIDMQNTFDVGVIKDQSDQAIFQIRNQGFANSQSLQNSINTARASKPSNTQIATTALMAGASAGLSVYKPKATKAIK